MLGRLAVTSRLITFPDVLLQQLWTLENLLTR
jgi:hypothetical protein